MRTKLLRRLRKRAFWAVGMAAWRIRDDRVEYCVGERVDIWTGNYGCLDRFLIRYKAEDHLRFLRQDYILSLVKDLRLDIARKQLKKLNREIRWL